VQLIGPLLLSLRGGMAILVYVERGEHASIECPHLAVSSVGVWDRGAIAVLGVLQNRSDLPGRGVRVGFEHERDDAHYVMAGPTKVPLSWAYQSISWGVGLAVDDGPQFSELRPLVTRSLKACIGVSGDTDRLK
jgi:hypothetical protein